MRPFANDIGYFPTNDKWTARDRTNVEIWAKIADGESHNQHIQPRATLSVLQDTALLHAAGFTLGFTGKTWFGKDSEGYLWRVTHRSEWSRNREQSPVKPDKWEPTIGTMGLNDFRMRFTSNYGSKRQ